MDNFYKQCYNEAVFEIKKVLFVGAFAEYYNISVSSKEIKQYLKNVGVSTNNTDKKEIGNVKYELLKNKVMDYIIEYKSSS